MGRRIRGPSKRERDFQRLVDDVFARWQNPVGTRATVERKIFRDLDNPDRMAIWEQAAQSKGWRIV